MGDPDPHEEKRNFTYFSFFSELHHSDYLATTIVETVAITAVFLVSVAANAGAAALVTWERRLLANKTILILNLFVADLLFVSMIPLIVAERWTVSWTLGYMGCHTVLYVICMSGCVIITTLASISAERVHAILRLQTVSTLNPRMVTATLFLIWAFSALTCIPLSLFLTVMDVDDPKQVQMDGLMDERKTLCPVPLINSFCVFSTGKKRCAHLYSQVARCNWRDCVDYSIHCPVLPSPRMRTCGQLQQNITGGFIVLFDWQRCQEVKEGAV